jgi:dihydroorotate dehydrogenase
MYKLLRNILFLFDAEKVHHFSMSSLRLLCKNKLLKRFISNRFTPSGKPVKVFGLQFRNLVGLAAGFDKNAKFLNELEALGFGFVEIGTVTPLPQEGNSRPRLFRLPKDKALINRMGFNNEGVVKVAERLKDWKQSTRQIIIGGNIGKNKITPNQDAWKDYEICFKELFDYVDYFVVNVSSPNTPGLRALQDKQSLKNILLPLQSINNSKTPPKPLLLKIAPDLSLEEIDEIIEVAQELKLSGLVIANTTVSREGLITSANEVTKIGAGGLSGLPLRHVSTKMVRYISEKTNGQIPIMASGGIFAAEDAKEKINAGATLIQVWTGFIYEGPAIARRICKRL